jgi:hypothetical protein
MNKTLSLIALVLATASASFAGQTVSSKKIVAPAEDSRFRANEWQVDTSVVGAGGNYNNKSGGGVGGNLGINYFFTQYIGIGVDNSVGAFWKSQDSAAEGVDSVQADLLVRYPITSWNLAPYVMIGGGGAWGSASQGDGNVGGGFEWRFARNVGLFADARWLYGGATNMGQLSIVLPRAGVRFIF